MTRTTATPAKPSRRLRHALEFAAGCLLVALLIYVGTLLLAQGVPAVFAFMLPFAMVSLIVGKWGRSSGNRG